MEPNNKYIVEITDSESLFAEVILNDSQPDNEVVVISDNTPFVVEVSEIGAPGAPGADGISAFRSAQLGGYPVDKTEEEFNEELANISSAVIDPEYVHTDNNYTDTDKSNSHAPHSDDQDLSGLEPLLPSTPENPSNKFLDGNRQWNTVPIGAGGFSAPLYFSNEDSDVVGYKKINYTNDEAQIELSGTITNEEALLRTYLYDEPLGLTVVDAGLWVSSFRVKVNKATGVTQLKFEAFVRHGDNTETTLFSDYSQELNNLDYVVIRKDSPQPVFSVASTDRLGVRVYGKTTSTAAVTIYTTIGDGDASYFTTPIPFRHNLLRGLDYENSGHTGFQEELIDNVNIKTIYGQSILGIEDMKDFIYFMEKKYYDIINSQYETSSVDLKTILSVSTLNVAGFRFSTDGLFLYACCPSNDAVYQFELSTPYDLSTITYNNKFINITSTESIVDGLAISNDGYHLLLSGVVLAGVAHFPLPTPWDITSFIPGTQTVFATGTNSNIEVAYSADGTKMYIGDGTNDCIRQYTLITPWEITGAIYDGSASTQPTSGYPRGLAFSNNGLKLAIVDSVTDLVTIYNLSTAWDVTSEITFEGSFSVTTQENTPTSIDFNDDGSKMFISGNSNDMIYQYNVVSDIYQEGNVRTDSVGKMFIESEIDEIKRISDSLSIGNEHRYAYNSVDDTIKYIGIADLDVLDSAIGWSITKMVVATDGGLTITHATGIWNDRETLIYI